MEIKEIVTLISI